MCQGFVLRPARWVISALSEKCYLRRTAPSYRKLCPYLHVVSLLRDQIPGRAWNPDNSSFDPVPVGSTTRPSRPSYPLTLSAPENE